VNNAARSIRTLMGSLFAAPLVAICFGSQWSWDERIEPAGLRLVADDVEPVGPGAPLLWLADGTDLAQGVQLPPHHSARIALPRPLDRFEIELQADGEASFRIESAPADGPPVLLWTALGAEKAGALVTRRSPPLLLDNAARALLITPTVRRAPTAVSGLRLVTPRWSLRHALLVPLPWIVWGGLWWLRRRPFAARAFAVWQRADPWLAVAWIYAMLFRLAVPGAAGAGALAAIAAGVWLVRRRPAIAAACAATAALAAAVIPAVLSALVTRMVAEQFDLSVDHRLKPDGANINSDGIRFRGEAEDLDRSDFVVLFLGDSFTFGTRLRRNETTYPGVFEALLNSRGCRTPVRAVNFGWPSASPLLASRLLRQIGAKYQPDLVIYSLDMTDFHDDLRYERALRSADEYELDTAQVLRRLVDQRLPWLNEHWAARGGLDGLLRPRRPRRIEAGPGIPDDPFFATSQPLDESRPWIEAGVMKNLRAIHEFAGASLGVPMLLVVYPRAYQYSDRESPANWERRAYRALGPFVREPFRYFEAAQGDLPYPVVSLLAAFENAETSPLFFSDDPHWNRDGAKLAGARVAEAIEELQLIPCEAKAAQPD
jgi:lysophospholipase L1-like esterase